MWGDQGTRVLASDAMWNVPLTWNRWAAMRGQSMTIGEAVRVYGKELPECEGHEWDNRTTAENNQWLIDNGVDPMRRPRVFCASLSDVFEDWDGPIIDSQGREVWFAPSEPDRMIAMRPDLLPLEQANIDAGHYRAVTMADVRARLFRLIDATPNLDWLLLTKRPENVLKMWVDKAGDYIPEAGAMNPPSYRSNVWLGCSTENQEYADKRVPELLKCRDLSPVLFLSCEPLLGPVNLWQAHLTKEKGSRWPAPTRVDWVIAGGESGNEKDIRWTHPAWIRSLRDQCKTAGIPFHFKQWGEWGISKSFDGGEMADARVDICGRDVKELHGLHSETDAFMDRDGVKNTGRLLDGVLHNEFPRVS